MRCTMLKPGALSCQRFKEVTVFFAGFKQQKMEFTLGLELCSRISGL